MKTIYDGEGYLVLQDGSRFFIEYDAGHFVSVYKQEEISAEEAIEAQKSPENAYLVILKCQKRAEAAGRKWWEPNG